MNKIVTLVAASFLATAGVSSHALAQGAGVGGSVGGGAEVTTPGAMDGATPLPAPGLQMQGQDIDRDRELTTGTLGDANFGTVISIIRSGEFNIGSIESDADVEIVRVNELPGADSAALDNAVEESEDRISELRSDLQDLELTALEDQDIDMQDVVAARAEADGSLTVFVR
jgi:hypothetical protein